MSKPVFVRGSGSSRPRGFSLAELVLALGVLAIGLTMAAALFPAAIKLNELSTRDSIGTIVATNGLAVARTVLHQPDFTDPSALTPITDPNVLDLLKYDFDPNAPPTTRGVLVLGRPLNGIYQLVIVSYDKSVAANDVTPESVTVTVAPGFKGATAVTLNPKNLADCRGAALICVDGATLVHARITDGDPNTGVATLDHDIGNPTQGILIVEGGGLVKKSPVMTVLVAETILAP